MKKGLLFLLLPFLLLGFQSCLEEDNDWDGEGANEIAAGDLVPTFSVLDNDGKVFDNNALKGRTSVLAFFTTRCGDCRKELPVVEKLYQEFGADKDVSFMMISLSEEDASLSNYWYKNGLTLPYSSQSDKQIYNLFANRVIPMLYIIDRKQIVRYVHSDNPLVDYNTLYKEFNEVRTK